MQGDIGMVKVLAQGKTFYFENGANLHKVLLENNIALYNGGAAVVNCSGTGSCGTSAVEVEGEISEANWRSLPPYSPTRDLHLACQTQVLDDVSVTKFDGFWGQPKQIVWS